MAQWEKGPMVKRILVSPMNESGEEYQYVSYVITLKGNINIKKV